MAISRVPRLRELREASNMTQEEVGKLIGGNGRTMYKRQLYIRMKAESLLQVLIISRFWLIISASPLTT